MSSRSASVKATRPRVMGDSSEAGAWAVRGAAGTEVRTTTRVRARMGDSTSAALFRPWRRPGPLRPFEFRVRRGSESTLTPIRSPRSDRGQSQVRVPAAARQMGFNSDYTGIDRDWIPSDRAGGDLRLERPVDGASWSTGDRQHRFGKFGSRPASSQRVAYRRELGGRQRLPADCAVRCLAL